MSSSATLDPPVTADTPFAALGGEAGVRRLVDAFDDLMDVQPALRSLRDLHGADLGPMRTRLADWLSGWLGGPPVYGARHPDRPCIMSAHRSLSIGPVEAEQWMACMRQALDRVAAPDPWRQRLDAAFARMCEAMRSH